MWWRARALVCTLALSGWGPVSGLVSPFSRAGQVKPRTALTRRRVSVAAATKTETEASGKVLELARDLPNSVAENPGGYLAIAGLQLLPGVLAGDRAAALFYFWSLSVITVTLGSLRPRLDDAPALTARQALLAPVFSSVTLFGFYLILKYTDLDPSVFYRVFASFLGLICAQEVFGEASAAALADSDPEFDLTGVFGESEAGEPTLVPASELGGWFLGASLVGVYLSGDVSDVFQASRKLTEPTQGSDVAQSEGSKHQH